MPFDTRTELERKVEQLQADNLQLWAALGMLARRALGDKDSPLQTEALRDMARTAQQKLSN